VSLHDLYKIDIELFRKVQYLLYIKYNEELFKVTFFC